MKVKKILVPVDGSKYSSKAASYAGDFAKLVDAEVVLLFVKPVMSLKGHNNARKKIRQEVLLIERKGVAYVSLKVREGVPWEEIVEEARTGYDMIIMGHKGLTGISRMLVGSVAENVTRYAPCPVTIVR